MALCKKPTNVQKSNHNHFLSEHLHRNMQMILHVGKFIVTAQNTGSCSFFHHCYVYATSGVNHIIFQLQNHSISHSQISLHHAACALP